MKRSLVLIAMFVMMGLITHPAYGETMQSSDLMGEYDFYIDSEYVGKTIKCMQTMGGLDHYYSVTTTDPNTGKQTQSGIGYYEIQYSEALELNYVYLNIEEKGDKLLEVWRIVESDTGFIVYPIAKYKNGNLIGGPGPEIELVDTY